MTQPTCPLAKCGRPIPDQAYCCHPCALKAAHLLGQTIGLLRHVVETIARQDHIGEGGRGSNDEHPLPSNPDASTRYAAAKNEIHTWARVVAAERGRDTPDTIAAALQLLSGECEWLRHQTFAERAFPKLTDACRDIERITDRRTSKVLVGRCPCGTWLYAPPQATNCVCRGCNTTYDVASSRASLREELGDRIMTGAEIATMALYLGIVEQREPARRLIKVWAQRGKIAPHGSLQGDPAYRFDEVLPLLVGAYKRVA